MTAEEILRLADPWMAPVSAEQPGGERADDDDRYVAVVAEIERLQSPSEMWASRLWNVVSEGGALLRERSKDFRIATYMAYVMHRKNGIEGLLTGAALLTALIETYWSTMFPEAKRIKARANALGWFVERSSDLLSRHKPSLRERETLQGLSALLARLQHATRERFGDAAPSIRPLREAVERLLFDVDIAPDDAPSPLGFAPELSAPPSDVKNMASWLRDMSGALVYAAHIERRADPSRPLSYRLMRAGLYTSVVAAPVTAASEQSTVVAPPSGHRERIAALASQRLWGALLEEAELTLAAYRFWLDLHRHSAAALAGLGDAHGAASAEVTRETLALLRRVPELLSMRFDDGTPFADEVTRRWILGMALR